jgi:hypothetical protein
MAAPGRYSVPQVARLLGISERAVRKRISVGSLDAERDGSHWVVLLDAAPDGGTAPEPEAVPGGTGAAPAEVEQAIERTAARYVADMGALYDRINAEVGRLYEAQLAAKDETIAELRRRAEAAEAALAAPPPPSAPEAPMVPDAPPVAPAPARGLRAALRRWWRGEGGIGGPRAA